MCMKKRYVPLLLFVLFASCKKRYELESLDSFTVTADKTSYRAGDTIRFTFTGHPDNVVYWSGEHGHVYEYRNRTFAEGNKIQLNFKSFSQYGIADPSTLKLLVSTDFSGVYDSASIRSATWEDITGKAVLSTGADQTPSGDIDLSEFAARNKKISIAFRFKTETVKTEVTQNRWVIRSFDLNSINEAGENTVLANMATAGWTAFNFSGASSAWTVSSVQLLSGRNFVDLDDDWAVTKQFNPNSVMPDQGQPIKNISQKLNDYVAVYNNPGTYKVVFVANNSNVKDQQSVVKEITLNITAPEGE